MLIKQGDRGDKVADVQRNLDHLGYKLKADGIFGPKTDAAVRKFQRSHELIDDGIVGPRTLRAIAGELGGDGELKPEDIKVAADRLGVDVPSVLALIEVESRGEGFLSDMPGKPVILFERHIMYRRLRKKGMNAAHYHQKNPGIVNPEYGGYQGGAREHARLNMAKQIDPAIAIESASWGLFQIMGFHWKALGYPSAADFEALMSKGEAQQLDAFVRFVLNDRSLLASLKRQDWADVARRYNGPAYKRNNYDRRLAAAYDRHSAAYESTV